MGRKKEQEQNVQVKTIKKKNVPTTIIKEVDVEEMNKHKEKVKTYPKREICGDCFYNGYCNNNAKTCMFKNIPKIEEEE